MHIPDSVWSSKGRPMALLAKIENAGEMNSEAQRCVNLRQCSCLVWAKNQPEN